MDLILWESWSIVVIVWSRCRLWWDRYDTNWQVQPSTVIMWSNITWHWKHHCCNRGRISIRIWITKRHPKMPRPNGELWGVFCEDLLRILTALYSACIWKIFKHESFLRKIPQTWIIFSYINGHILAEMSDQRFDLAVHLMIVVIDNRSELLTIKNIEV